MRNSEQFSVDVHGVQFVLSIHTENPAHEARIRWETINQDLSGEWGRLYLPEDMPKGADQVIQEPILAFGSRKSIAIDGKERKSIELPRSLALRLQNILDDFGTATSNADSICDGPSQFPPDIQYQTQISTQNLNKKSWDANQRIMWYAPDRPQAQSASSQFAKLVNELDVYAYQIENEKLIHRTEEYPSSEAVDELKRLLQQATPNLDEQPDTDSYRINEPLK
jgi:hypothetical protein